MFFGVFSPDSIAYLHDLVSNKVSDSPAFVDSELFDVRNQILVDLVHWKHLGKVDDAVNALHADAVLVVLIQLSEDLKQFYV